jgi:hypothetical protein
MFAAVSMPVPQHTQTGCRSAHFIDPFLRAILECSFTPDDNDLFLSNLVDTPVLAIHGCALYVELTNNIGFMLPSGADKNVPTWHSREAVSILKTWAADTIVQYAPPPFVSIPL